IYTQRGERSTKPRWRKNFEIRLDRRSSSPPTRPTTVKQRVSRSRTKGPCRSSRTAATRSNRPIVRSVSIGSGTRSKTSSVVSRIGGASPPATTNLLEIFLPPRPSSAHSIGSSCESRPYTNRARERHSRIVAGRPVRIEIVCDTHSSDLLQASGMTSKTELHVISGADLQRFASALFAAAGVAQAMAEEWARSLVWANLRGVDSHGVLRIPGYIE